ARRRVLGGRPAHPDRGGPPHPAPHRDRGPDRNGAGACECRRDRAGQPPTRGDAFRGRGSGREPAGPHREHRRLEPRLPRRSVARGAGAHGVRVPRVRAARDRRTVWRLQGRRGIPRGGAARGGARLRGKVGDPPIAGRARERRVHAAAGRGRARAPHLECPRRRGTGRPWSRPARRPDDRRRIRPHGTQHRRHRDRHRGPQDGRTRPPGRHAGLTVDIHEYQAKELLSGFGVPVPKGGVAYSAEQAVYRTTEIGGSRWVVKAQIHSGARGKAGGVRLCATDADVRHAAKDLLGKVLVTRQTGPEGLPVHRVLVEQAMAAVLGAYRAFRDLDATMVEFNPLVVVEDGHVFALDVKMSFDDNAMFRRPNVAELRDYAQEDPREADAAEHGLNYVALDGDIGCIINGAGLAMATMDMIQHSGGEPANFLDIGGGASPDRVAAAFRLVLSDRNVKAILVNVFAGINRCDWVAEGVVQAIREVRVPVPLVVRLAGTNVDEGRRILQESGLSIVTAATLAEAAERVVAARHAGAAA